MKKTKRKMQLSSETIRNLGARELAEVGGNGWIGKLYYWLTGTCSCPGDDGDAGSGGIRG